MTFTITLEQCKRIRELARLEGITEGVALDRVLAEAGLPAGPQSAADITLPSQPAVASLVTPVTGDPAISMERINSILLATGVQTEKEVQRDVILVLRKMFGARPPRHFVKLGAESIPVGQMIYLRTSLLRRATGADEGIPDLWLIRWAVWGGWEGFELKSRTKTGKCGTRTRPEQKLLAASSPDTPYTLAWHPRMLLEVISAVDTLAGWEGAP